MKLPSKFRTKQLFCRAEMWLRTSSIYLIIWCSIIPLTYSAIYSNLWAVHIKGGERVARSVAEETGFVYLNKVMACIYNRCSLQQACQCLYISTYIYLICKYYVKVTIFLALKLVTAGIKGTGPLLAVPITSG